MTAFWNLLRALVARIRRDIAAASRARTDAEIDAEINKRGGW